MITNTTFDTGRKRYYSNTGYYIQDQNGNKYYDMAILDSVIDDYTLSETDEKIPLTTTGLGLKLNTPRPNYTLILGYPSENKETVNVEFGDGTRTTVNIDDNIIHNYTLQENYYITLDTDEVIEYWADDKDDIIEITIGTEITKIGECAFCYNKDLNTVIFKSTTPPTLVDDCFLDTTATVIVPTGCSEVYTEALSNSGGTLTIRETNEDTQNARQ